MLRWLWSKVVFCRLWLVLCVGVLGGGAVAWAAPLCPLPISLLVTQSARVTVDGEALVVMVGSVPAWNHYRVRLIVDDAACRNLMDWQVKGLEARFDVRRLGHTQFVHFVSLQAYGDGNGYVHRLFDIRGGRPHLRFAIKIYSKDGFYLGPLVSRHGVRRGEGIVTWVGQVYGSMADPRPYVVTTWRWHDGVFLHPTAWQTKKAYDYPEVIGGGAMMARAMHLPYRDQTGRWEFMDDNRFFKALDRLEKEDGFG